MDWLYQILDWLMGYHRHVTDTRQGLWRLQRGQEDIEKGQVHLEEILADIEQQQRELTAQLEARLERLQAEADTPQPRRRGTA